MRSRTEMSLAATPGGSAPGGIDSSALPSSAMTVAGSSGAPPTAISWGPSETTQSTSPSARAKSTVPSTGMNEVQLIAVVLKSQAITTVVNASDAWAGPRFQKRTGRRH